MKKQFLSFLLLPFFTLAQKNQPCDINNFTPKWVALGDERTYYGPNEKYRTKNFDEAKMKPYLQVALNWTKQQAKNVKGSKEARYYNYFNWGFPDPEIMSHNIWYQATGRISSYHLKVFNNGLFCRENQLGTLVGPSEIYIYFNDANEIALPMTRPGEKGSSLPLRINGKVVFEVPDIKRSDGRVDYYEYPGPPPPSTVNYAKWNFINGYIIRNSDKPLIIPFTRKEYLQQYLLEMGSTYKQRREVILKETNVKSPDDIDKELKERIAEIKKFTEQGAWGYSKEDLENRIKKAEEFFQNKKVEEANKIKSLIKDADDNYLESVTLIKEHLQNKPDSELKKPVTYRLGQKLVNTLYESTYTRRTLEELDAGHGRFLWGNTKILCYYNKDYFNNSLPADAPQFISIEFVNLENIHKNLNDIVENINREFDFKALEVLLKK